jgi:hypothetical protein
VVFRAKSLIGAPPSTSSSPAPAGGARAPTIASSTALRNHGADRATLAISVLLQLSGEIERNPGLDPGAGT